jgi:hypothetical protein
MGTNATVMFQQTLAFNMSTLLLALIDAGGPSMDFTKARSFVLEFDTREAGETWLSDIALVRK